MLSTSELGKYINPVLFLGIGIYLVIYGSTSKILINEADVVATEEEKRNATATPARRVAVVAAGLAGVIYGVYGVVRLMK
jgi:hypothetical protein